MQKATNIILGLIALDLATDVALINTIFAPKVQEFKDRHPLIGERYIVRDGSWGKDKETGIDVHYLTGKEYIIVSDPYVEWVHDVGLDPSKHLFVDVFSPRSSRKYRVLFAENGIVKD